MNEYEAEATPVKDDVAIDADTSGQLAFGLFVGVLLVLLVVIYAFASAA